MSNAIDTNSTICGCSNCCNVEDSSDFHMTSVFSNKLVYPTTSLDGSYTLFNFTYYDDSRRMLSEGRRELATNSVMKPYQLVFPWTDTGNAAFHTNIMFYEDIGYNSLNCTESFMYYGISGGIYKEIEFIEFDNSGTPMCKPNINGVLTRSEVADASDVWIAMNRLVDEGTAFYMQRNPTDDVIPKEDENGYPYSIRFESANATDVNNAGPGGLYIDFEIDVVDDYDLAEPIDATCLGIDDLMLNGNAYWLAEDGSSCTVEALGNPSGDATVLTSGREYHFKLGQVDYESCAKSITTTTSDIVFEFELHLPRDYTETVENTDAETCLYFFENNDIQTYTVSIPLDITNEVGSEFTNFRTEVSSLTPVRCDDNNLYPTPHSTLEVVLTATFPTDSSTDFDQVSNPYFGEVSNVLLWNNQAGTPQIDCEIIQENGASVKQCTFSYVSSTCEPTFVTDQGTCAFERNTNRKIVDFAVREVFPGGQYVVHQSPDIETGIDSKEFTLNLCEPADVDPTVNVNDEFEIQLKARNFYDGYAIDWDNTTGLKFDSDVAIELTVGQGAGGSIDFTSLDVIIKTILVTLKDPQSGNVITSYNFAVGDKINFMDKQWSPYYVDPIFCRFYDSTNSIDRCRPFFSDAEGRPLNDLTQGTIDNACQVTNFFSPADEDNLNTDYWVFNPKEWFLNNILTNVDVEFSVTAVIHQCGPQPTQPADSGGVRRLNAQNSIGGYQPEDTVIYVTDKIVVTFNEETGDIIDSKEITNSSTLWDEYGDLIIALAVTTGVMFVAVFSFGIYRVYNIRSKGYKQERARIHDF